MRHNVSTASRQLVPVHAGKANSHWLLGIGSSELSAVDLRDDLIRDHDRYAELPLAQY